MHSLVSSGLPFNATNPSMPSNDTTFSATSSSMPSNFTHSAGVQHSTIPSNDCHDGSEVHPAVVKPPGNSSLRRNKDINEFVQETFSSVMGELMKYDCLAYIRESNSENDSNR